MIAPHDSATATEPTNTAARGQVSLRAVTKRFGRTVAVDGVDLDVAAGEFLSVLGPSGCGKTTLLRMIAGFEQPDAGDVSISGQVVNALPPFKRDVNTVFQQYALFPHLSVFDNVAFGPRAKRLPEHEVKRRVDDVLEIVRMAELARRRPGQLSGGQQQRCALARALVNQPSALLLDEPLGALDLKLRQTMQEELKRIHREVGTTFVLVTHDQEEALTMSDRVAIMNNGRLEQVASAREVYERPATTFVAGFIGSANLLPAVVERVVDGSSASVVITAAQNRASSGSASNTPRCIVATATTLTAGQHCVVMVRPEAVQLVPVSHDGGRFDSARSDSGRAADGGVLATVVDLLFQGPVIRVLLAADDGTELVAHVDARAATPLARGQHALVSWAPGAGLALAGASTDDGQPMSTTEKSPGDK